MLGCTLAGTASEAPEREVLTSEIAAALGRSSDRLEERTGIRARRWFRSEDDVFDASASALRSAMSQAGRRMEDGVDRVILVSSPGVPQLIPAGVNEVIRRAGWSGRCDGFDLNNACLGFLTALDLAARSLQTGMDSVAIVVIEVLSRFIDSGDPRPYAVLADGVTATIVTRDRPDAGLLSVVTCNDPSHPKAVHMQHPGWTKETATIQFSESNETISLGAAKLVRKAAMDALAQSGVAIGEIAWWVTHQPNGRLTEKLCAALDVDPVRVTPVAPTRGSLGAASMPTGLHQVMTNHHPQPGDLFLLMGIGTGVAYGAAVYRH